ncbi:SET domain-containing protein [Candidatus Giovannonibacteria bacterium]|nr:SET domain-containing protein [Candidatus Giovannonibacteria bacterium]
MDFFIKDHGRIFSLKVPRGVKLVYQPIKGMSLFADRNFRVGEKITGLSGKITSASIASPEAIQVSANYFLDGKDYVPEDFINHACEPNTRLDIERRRFAAIKNIPKNCEITFNYNTTEFDMAKYGTDFICICGSKKCLGEIKGFKYLSMKQKIQLKPYLSTFLSAN